METNFFRHYLATLSYRATMAIKDAPSHYPEFQAGKGVRTPVEILSHTSDVLTLAYSWFVDNERNKNIGEWDVEVERFYSLVEKLDQAIADDKQMKATKEQLLQGPLADALTHVGQLIMLRRLADAPTPRENYIKADINIGTIRPNSKGAE
ncbi:hypothetical protein BTR23_21170 [Alkalihalophilus pseudofirmus]|uniref:hypothetical protein n=1 Tax=Alkalihalobacterium alkalinitrilicum TaxID=427920 RepID=UPI00094C4FF7|nr:hypothetical protein [Alkalihalobacterium alkalinitrilicum]OLO27047.1 hypothetical protein BTR23_21170 [Alkalihalophilus pseudofirmus]